MLLLLSAAQSYGAAQSCTSRITSQNKLLYTASVPLVRYLGTGTKADLPILSMIPLRYSQDFSEGWLERPSQICQQNIRHQIGNSYTPS